MNLNELYPFAEERQSRKRVGRGSGSGLGCTSGKGNKGQNARSGGGVRPGFEGGQLPLYRKLPKRGFNNKNFAKNYACINVDVLNRFNDGDTVNLAALVDARIIRKPFDGLKVLGNGELTKKLTVEAKVFTGSAKEKIEAAGGKTEVV